MRTLSITKNDSDDNHWEKVSEVKRVSGGIPDAKVDPFRSEISELYVMLKSYANVFVLKMANWA